MNNALVGYTGFVGGALSRQAKYSHFYNSKNIHNIDGNTFDLIVCAAAPGIKWKANLYPDKDLASISQLISHLRTVSAKMFVLISTIDVYSEPYRVTENIPIIKINGAYGKNRYLLERFVASNFTNKLIVRLPALFGKGLKKNAVYDMIHDNDLAKLNPKSEFQYYNLNNLWSDIQYFLQKQIHLVNLVTEPISLQTIFQTTFGKTLPQSKIMPSIKYDVRSIHAKKRGKKDYFYMKEEILPELHQFILSERKSI